MSPTAETYPGPGAGGLQRTDCHTHVGLDGAFYAAGWLPYAASAQDLLGHLDTHALDRAVCFPFCIPTAFEPTAFAKNRVLRLLPGRFPFDCENVALLREIELLEVEDRLLPFAMFDPGREASAQLTALDRLSDRIVGLKTQTSLLRSPIGSLRDSAREFMTFAEERDLPVVVHTAVSPTDEWAQVRDCLAVAADYPKVRFNLAHSLRFDIAALEEATQLANVWVDCSAHLLHCHLARLDSPVVPPVGARVDADYANPPAVLEAIHAIVGERYLWGSDSPYQSWADDEFKGIFTYRQEIETVDQLRAHVARSMTRTAPCEWLGR